MVTTARIDGARCLVRRILVVAFISGSCSEGDDEDTAAEGASTLVEVEAEALVDSEGGDDPAKEPGDWEPSCTDPSADQMAWNSSWVQHPAFEAVQDRAYHEARRFDSILTEATAPLGQCSADHVQAVQALVEPTGQRAPETYARILTIFDDLVASIQGDTASPTETTGDLSSSDTRLDYITELVESDPRRRGQVDIDRCL